MADYHQLAEEIAGDISAGKLAAGQKLLPQREYAYQRGIAASTAGRVYKELLRRGLVTGEVGRGTYVRYAPDTGAVPLAEPPEALVNLDLNIPGVVGEPARLADAFLDLVRNPHVFEQSMQPIPADGWETARRAMAHHVSTVSWTPSPDQILFAGNGKQALSAVISALAGPGERLGIEALTYPVAKTIAEKQKTVLVPLRMDEHGVLPDEIDRIGKSGGVKAIYVQPGLQNPTGATMPRTRRVDIAECLQHYDLIAIEDRVYSFLADERTPPLAALAPRNVVAVDSLSKRLCAGLSIGLIAAPSHLVERCRLSINQSGLTPQRIPLEVAVRWVLSGVAKAVERDKRQDARQRNKIARRLLKGWDIATDHNSYHLWLTLPPDWRSEDFAARAKERGIAVTPATAFAVEPAMAPNAVRLALASPRMNALKDALTSLASLLQSPAR